MTPNKFTILSSSIFLLLLTHHPLLPHAAKPHEHSKFGKDSSLLGFFRHFIGTHEGNKVKNLHLIKKYFSTFGYLNNKNSTYNINQANPNNDDLFDRHLEEAVKLYQEFFKLDVNGVLDLKTITQMSQPRCGVPDIVTGSDKLYDNNNIGAQYYKFFWFKPRWKTTRLTYSFGRKTSENAKVALRRALASWANVTKFTFSETKFRKSNTIKMSFKSGFHWDWIPFDGPGGVLAHANPPRGGNVHFDRDEVWSSESRSRYAFDLETVGLHELGHALGLAHTNVEDAIMFPVVSPGEKKGLGKDDIEGINALYHFSFKRWKPIE